MIGAAAALALLPPTAAMAGGKSGNSNGSSSSNGNGNGNGGSGASGGGSSGNSGGASGNGASGNGAGASGNGSSGGGASGNGNSGNGGSGNGNSGGGSSGSGNAGGSSGGGANTNNAGGSSSNSGNGGVVLMSAPCVLQVGTSCLFQGNINLDNKLAEVDDAYNGQTPAPSTLLHLTDLTGAEQDTGFSDPHSGTVNASFWVQYYAVKAGDYFRLYEIAPSQTFSWSTAGLVVGNGQQPTVSHVVWFDPPAPFTPPTSNLPTGGIPEPAAWALMITGFGFAGAMFRRQRRLRTA